MQDGISWTVTYLFEDTNKNVSLFYVRISCRPTYRAKSMPIDGIMISELVFEE